jgi:hypothetical protein
MHRSLRVPDQREDPFFPLSPRRPCWTINPGAIERFPPARVAASAPNGITHIRSPRYGLPLPGNYLGSCCTVPFAEQAEPVNLQRPRLLPQRRFADGNGSARCAIRLRATVLQRVSPVRCSASFPANQPVAARCCFPRHIDSRVREYGLHDSGPVCAGKTAVHGRDKQLVPGACSVPPSGSVDKHLPLSGSAPRQHSFP